MKFEQVKLVETIKHNRNLPATIKVDERGFYISKIAVEIFSIRAGQYMHLVKGKNEKNVIVGWYLVFNDIKEDGFIVNPAHHDAALICNRPLRRLFCREVACELKDAFYLQKTESMIGEYPVIEILTHKTAKAIRNAK